MFVQLFTILIASVLCKTPYNTDRVLVLYDNNAVFVSHSGLFHTLKEMGYQVEIRQYGSPNINLMSYGEYNYDHLLLFASSDDEMKTFKPKEVADFFDSGRNVLILGNPDQNKIFRHLINAFGVDMHELGSAVYDHFNNIHPSDPLTVTTNNVVKNSVFLQALSKPVLFRGAGLSLTLYENNQVYGLVRGQETAYSKKIDQDETIIIGSNVVYVAATQGRNNARVVITGGWDVFSNEFLTNQEYDNQKLAESLIKWGFGQNGVLKVGEVIHRKIDSTATFPLSYRLEEQVIFSTEIWQWDSLQNTWVAYNAPTGDVMMEFVMLDPYYRVPLKQNIKSPQVYEIEFKIPDKYGIFQFKVNYNRPGFSFLKIAEKVTIRPFRHDEYPRYLVQAYPYYLSSFGTMLGFVIFLAFFLLHKDNVQQKEKLE